MDEERLLYLIKQVKDGLLDEKELAAQIKAMPFRTWAK